MSSARATDESKANAQAIFQELELRIVKRSGTIDNKSSGSAPKVQPISPKAAPNESNWVESIPDKIISFLEVFPRMFKAAPIVFIFLLLAIGLQVKHIATLVDAVSQNDSFYAGVLFGISAECTAIVLTLHNSTSKRILMFYAFIQAWVNVLHYHVFDFEFCTMVRGIETCVQYWKQVTQLTLSCVLAFVIYTYSDIFTKLFSEKNGTIVLKDE